MELSSAIAFKWITKQCSCLYGTKVQEMICVTANVYMYRETLEVPKRKWSIRYIRRKGERYPRE
jgi:hypothetical protein